MEFIHHDGCDIFEAFIVLPHESVQQDFGHDNQHRCIWVYAAITGD